MSDALAAASVKLATVTVPVERPSTATGWVTLVICRAASATAAFELLAKIDGSDSCFNVTWTA